MERIHTSLGFGLHTKACTRRRERSIPAALSQGSRNCPGAPKFEESLGTLDARHYSLVKSYGSATRMSKRTSPPSAHDVARLAGVSQAAVSRAFTAGASIAKDTKDKVFRAANSIGYRPNL